MKVITDIDKDDFEILKYEERNGNDFKPIKLIANGTPLEEEFKKIKEEIEDTGGYEQEVHGKTEFLKGITYCLNIINKYIEELKGEKNE